MKTIWAARSDGQIGNRIRAESPILRTSSKCRDEPNSHTLFSPISNNNNELLMNTTLFPPRIALRGLRSARAFSTARVLRSDLSYQVFGPETEEATRSPILFLHGLFGSKQNNRSISR